MNTIEDAERICYRTINRAGGLTPDERAAWERINAAHRAHLSEIEAREVRRGRRLLWAAWACVAAEAALVTWLMLG